jgi:tetratricopeptide (TPR) repeat protein
MPDRDALEWPRPRAQATEEDSIAGQLASKIEALSPTPDGIDWSRAAADFEREATALAPRPAAAVLLFEAGRIHEERLADPAASLELHRRALAVDPSFVPNLRACRRLAMDAGEDGLAAEILEAEAAVAESLEARAELLLLRGRLLATLGRVSESNEVLARAMATAPGDFAAAEEAARTAAAEGDRGALADAYVRCARAAADRRLSAHYLSAASALLEEGLGNPDRAGALALDAFALLPDDPLLRATARRHAERLGRTDALATILRAEAEAAQGPAAADAWLAVAHLEERLARPEAAIAALERGREAAPGEPLVLTELARLREARGAWADASETLEALAAAHVARGGPGHLQEAMVARLRRAEIEENQLGRAHVAIRCCREILEVDPAHRGALAALGRLCARSQDWEGLLAAFEAEAAAARDPRERAHRSFKAAEILADYLGRVDDAIWRLSAALELDPDLVPARAALERLYEREGRWEPLCELLEGELTEQRSPLEEVAALFRLARLREERLGDLEAAADVYRRILELDPANRMAMPALASVLGRLDRFEELADLLFRDAELADDPRRRIAVLQRRAELLEERADDPEKARAAWEDVRVAAPSHLPALAALGRLHARAGRWEDLAAMYRAQADVAPDPGDAADLVYRAGELLERRADRVDEAVAAYRDALTLAPAHLPALQALERIYRARGDDEQLVDVLRAESGARVAAVERAAPLAEAARLSEERLREPERAIENYEEVLRIAPGFPPALNALDRLYAQTGRTEALAALRRSAPDASPEDRADRLLRLVRLEADRTGDRAAALRALDELLALAPDQPAALLLEVRLATDPARRARARTALAAAGIEPGPRAALLTGAALDLRPASARRAALSAAAALSPASPVLAPEEERRLRQLGDHAALARLLDAARGASADPATRASWAVRAAEAWDAAGDAERALDAYQAALAEVPGCLPALRGARALLARRQDWAAVRATLQAEGAALQDPRAAAAAFIDAAEIAEERFHDPRAALADYRAAAERAPLDGERLARLQASLGPADAAELAAVHEAAARAESDARRAAESWLAAARADLDSADGRARALGAVDRALEARPDLAPALELRAQLRADAGRHEEALADCEACIALGGEPRARLGLHLLAAAICHDGLRAPARALPHLSAALAIAPEDPGTLARLAHAQQDLGRRAEAAAALRRLAEVPGLAPEALVKLLLELADLEAKLGTLPAAVATCRRALALDPGNEAALRTLVRLEGASQDPWTQVAALETAAASARDPALRAEAHAQAARLHAGPLQGRTRAIEHLRAALAVDPTRDGDRATLAELLEESAPLAAVDEHRSLIARDPLRHASWAALYRHFERTRGHDRAYVAATVIRWLGAPVPGPGAERLLVEGDRQALAAPPPLGAEAWEQLRAPGDHGPLAAVIELAGDAIAEALGPAPGGRGEPLRADHPFRKVMAELARCLDLPEHELFPASPGRLDVEPGQPYAVRVGTDLARRTTAREQRFLLGRVAARLRSRSCLAELLPTPALSAWAVAAAHVALGAPEDDLSRLLARSLSRRARRALESPARALLAANPPPDPDGWRAAAARTADRVGLVLCGDPTAALDLLLKDGATPPRTREEQIALATARPDVRSLLAFAVSDAHFALRQRLRVAIA